MESFGELTIRRVKFYNIFVFCSYTLFCTTMKRLLESEKNKTKKMQRKWEFPTWLQLSHRHKYLSAVSVKSITVMWSGKSYVVFLIKMIRASPRNVLVRSGLICRQHKLTRAGQAEWGRASHNATATQAAWDTGKTKSRNDTEQPFPGSSEEQAKPQPFRQWQSVTAPSENGPAGSKDDLGPKTLYYLLPLSSTTVLRIIKGERPAMKKKIFYIKIIFSNIFLPVF